MDENGTVLENTSLFLDSEHAISQLANVISHFERDKFLLVVLCEDVMPVANHIATKLGLNLIFSDVDLNRKTADFVDKDIAVDFDYGMVKESGRDLPQDFIVHQEQNLRSDLAAIYKATFESMTKTYPHNLIILVDQLTNIDAAFFPCLTPTYGKQSGRNSFSNPAIRQFVFIHSRMATSEKIAIHGLNMIIGQSTVELGQLN